MTRKWRDAIKSNPSLSISDAMQTEIDELRSTTVRQQKHLKVLQDENITQWDEIVALREDAKNHNAIVRIYLDKIERLEKQLEETNENISGL